MSAIFTYFYVPTALMPMTKLCITRAVCSMLVVLLFSKLRFVHSMYASTDNCLQTNRLFQNEAGLELRQQ